MFSLFLLPPIYRAFISLLFAGASFPLAGVMVVRMNLMQLRYALMHGLLLGGSLSLALGFPQLPVYLAMCILTVIVMLYLSRGKGMNLGVSASFLMVASVAIAALITQVAHVPSKDTLELLWGSPFTIRWAELACFVVLAVTIIIFTLRDYRNITLVFFDRDVAHSSGCNVRFHENMIVFIIAFAVAFSMRFVGALLIDALLILPAVIALKRAESVKSLFILSSLTGLATSTAGFILSLALDLPPSSMIALVSVILYPIVPKRRNR